MEMLKANLLILLTLPAVVGAFILYANICDLPFREAFEYFRKKNREYENGIVSKIIVILSILVIAAYYLLCLLLSYQGVPFWNMIFVVAVLYTILALIQGFASSKKVRNLIILMSLAITLPIGIMVFGMAIFQICFDQYCGITGVLLVVWDIFLTKENLDYWKRGDF